jgi:CHAT domain-containing protein
MRRILAGLAFGAFLTGALWLPPLGLAQQVPAQESSKFEPGRLGIELRDLADQSIKALGLTQARAVLVAFTAVGGPAERAGVRPGDVIVEFEGAAVGPMQDLVAAIQRAGAGRTIALGVLRGKERLALRATLASAADISRAASDASGQAVMERRIAAYEAMSLTFDRKTFPEDWARVQLDLGAAYRARMTGDPPENNTKAIAAYEGAQTVFTREAYPNEWAAAESGLDAPRKLADIHKTLAFLDMAARVGGASAEEVIGIGQKALKLEREIGTWPPVGTMTREAARASVLRLLGLAYLNRQLGEKAENIELAITAAEEALGFLTREMSEEHWVGLQVLIADSYMARVRGDRADNLEKVIAAYEAALTVFTREGHPSDWPHTQANLGNAYVERIRGDRADNVEKALAAYELALTVFTRDGRPEEWAKAQMNVSNAYVGRVRGDWADNQEQAIAACEAALTVFTREGQPREWAMAQMNLGNAYGGRVRGDRASNQEKAIAASEAALTVFTRAASPIEWAKLQHNRATAYALRVQGDRADNAEKAVAGHEAALTILTRESRPREWAQTQSRLALAYAIRIRGERAANQARAIAASEAALTVFTKESQPREWADVHFSLASFYLDSVRGKSSDNAEKAIGSLEASLTVRTREAFPRDWAHTQHMLGGAYANLDRGDRAGNFEKAIDAYEAALTVLTREALPDGWADVQHHLSIAYEKRLNGDKAANLRQAVAAADAALTVRTRAARPHDHLLTAGLLGQVLLEAKDWRRAGVAYASARDTFLLLFGQGVNEADAGNLIAEAGYMFAQAAYAAVERGERLGALALASEGRGRLMNAALKVQALDLPAEKRARLDELRAAIRLEERAAQSAEGTGRAAAIDKLSALRQELLGLVKDGSATASTPEATVSAARQVAGNGGALVVPILTHVGTKILIATGEAAPAQSGDASDPATSASPVRSNPSRPSVTVLHLPELTVSKVAASLFAPYRPDGTMNWRLAYAINHMSSDTQERLWPKWLAAIEDLGPELWRLLGGRIDTALRELGVKRGARIVWMPPGILGTVPLGLAQDPKSKRRLVDSYEIVYAPSLEALASAQSQIARSTPATLAAIVNPTGDLAGSEKEGHIVASHFPAMARTVLERDAATSGAVLAALKGKSHWHFASHGTFSWDDARQSALVMHGMERLSVGRLLEADGLGRPRLVVLSACETGLAGTGSNPDEFIGLPGTFMALGASGVLATMWPVEDTATSLVMAKFYELHMGADGGAKLSPPTALRRAQLWLRQATNGDLQAYARDAAQQGRLESRHVAEIDRGLSEESLKRSRNAATVEWLVRNGAESTRPKKATPHDAERLARPYAHPYFWAGFTYTGL